MSRRRRNVLNMTGNGRARLCTVISGWNSAMTAPEIEQYIWVLNKPIPQPPTHTSLPVPSLSKSPPFDVDSNTGGTL